MIFLGPSERSLNKLFCGDALGSVTDQLVLIAIPTLALAVAGLSASQVSVLTASQWMPALLLSGVFGSLADSKDRRFVLGLAGLLSCVGAAAMGFVGAIEQDLRLVYLLVASLVYASGATLFAVGAAANLPRLVAQVPVAEAIGAQASVRNVARIVGLALTGPAVQWLGSVAGMFTAAVVSLAKTSIVASIPGSANDNDVRAAARLDKTSAWKVTLSSSTLLRLLIANSTMNAGGAMVVGSFFAFAYTILNLSPFSVGAMLFVGGAAAILASQRAKQLLEWFPAKTLCAITGLLAGASVWLVPASAFLPPLPTLFVYEAIFSSVATIFAISFAVVRQRMVASHLLGKLIAVSSTAAAGAMVAGGLAGALLIQQFGLMAALCGGCALSSVGALSLIGLIRVDPDGVTLHEADA
jgi:Na+/melibiose symporter-like transporter